MAFEVLNVFAHMEPAEVQWLLGTAEFDPVEAGDYILREGEPPLNIFFIADGLFDVSAYSGVGTIVKVGQLGPGDVVGEISWLDRKLASGSVMATETGMVMRLSTTKLEAKLKADPQFAAHFLRGVATLVAERLRKTTAQLRSTATAALSTPVAALEQALARALADFKAAAGRLGAAAQPAQPDLDALQSAFVALEREVHQIGADKLSQGMAEAIRQELRPLLQRSGIGARCVNRPRGYAGDFTTLAMIYAGEPSGRDALGRALDTQLLATEGLRGLRGRSALASAALRAHLRQANGTHLVTCLGAGTAPEVFALLAEPALAQRLAVTCIDVDREAVAHLEDAAQAAGAADRLTALHANLLHLATGRDELGLDPQDVIYSVSLLDALGDDAALALVDWIFRRLKPGGTMLLGAIRPENRSRELMEGALDWRIAHRSETQLTTLVNRSRFGNASVTFTKDASHPGFLAVVQKG